MFVMETDIVIKMMHFQDPEKCNIFQVQQWINLYSNEVGHICQTPGKQITVGYILKGENINKAALLVKC